MSYMPEEQLLEQWVSPERLTRYRAAREDTVELYIWNAKVSAHLLELIAHGEVLLRNAIHAKLAPHHADGKWYRDTAHYRFASQAEREIQTAVVRATRGGKPETAGKVVAELTFGFWRYALSARYKTTVWPRVKTAFLGVPAHLRTREDIERIVVRLHDLRNRVAHHEPVFHQSMHQHFADIVSLATYIDDRAGRMIADQIASLNLVAKRPAI
ncbi:TIORF34 protein [Leucobacter sp. 7(1)]|uniref:Abi family protein n=1 Tax=Leucobacter sp. 7(1) TaxID=1255613 RepID=UPI00097F5DC1|nr:Abi family protein [Leucobacter sp. 7(1)]SJN09092.1 TIORF34 protein [Leucobacter sp. 7(1)]